MFKKLSFSAVDYLFILLLMLSELARSAFFLTFWPLYSTHFLNFSIMTAGLVVSAHYLTETLLKITAGCQLDRYGRPVLILGLIISLVSLLGIYHQRNDVSIIILACLFGIGFAPVWLAVISNVAPVESADRAARMGVVFSAWLAGAGIGAVGVNFVISIGFRSTFKLIIAVWIICVILVIFAPLQVKTSSSKISLTEQFSRLVGDKVTVKVLLPGMFLQTLSASLLLPILPIYATTILGLNAQHYGWLLIAGGTSTVIFLVPMGRLVDKLPLKVSLTTGFLLSAFFLSMIPLTHDFYLIMALVIMVGMSYAFILPAWNNLLAKVIPAERQATGWGIFSTLEGLGIAVGPMLGGAIASLLHPGGAIYLSALILGTMGFFYLYYPFEKLALTPGVDLNVNKRF